LYPKKNLNGTARFVGCPEMLSNMIYNRHMMKYNKLQTTLCVQITKQQLKRLHKTGRGLAMGQAVTTSQAEMDR
jgi:hypothetical protein